MIAGPLWLFELGFGLPLKDTSLSTSTKMKGK